MTHEERTSWIKNGLFLALVIAIVAGVWFYPKPSEEAGPAAGPAVEDPLEIND